VRTPPAGGAGGFVVLSRAAPAGLRTLSGGAAFGTISSRVVSPVRFTRFRRPVSDTR
jgi:hypothetical protein